MALNLLLQTTCYVLGYPQKGNSHIVLGHHKEAEAETRHVRFQMPLHYPRYKKEDYEKMEEWKVDLLLREYGLGHFKGTLQEKRTFAMGAFLWPDQD